MRFKQPVGIVSLDRSNPLTKGLTVAINFANRTTVNAANGKILVPATTAASAISDNLIFTRNGPSTTPYSVPITTETGSNISCFVLMRHNWNVLVTANSNGCILAGGASANDLTVRGTSGSSVTSGTLSYDRRFNMFAAGMSFNGTTANIYSSGKLVTSGTTVTPTLSGNWTIGANPLGGAGNADMALCLIWSRTLSDAEQQSISDNPWQVFAPDYRQSYLIVNSASGSVGSSTGSSAVSGVSSLLSSSPGSSSGVGTANGVSGSIISSVGSSTGVGTVNGIGSFLGIGSVGSSVGIGTVSGTGKSLFNGVGSSAGISVATGLAPSISSGVGNSIGSSIVLGIALVKDKFPRLPIDPYLPINDDIGQLKLRIYDLYRQISTHNNKIADAIDKLNGL